jgi:restriction endonuclease S subunit
MNLKKSIGWDEAPLESLLDYYIGGDWGKDPNYEDNAFDLAYCIRGSEIRNWNENKGNTASLRKIKKSNISNRKLKEGDILVEISGGGPEQPVGRTILIDKASLSFEPSIPKICTNFLRLIRPKDSINSKFLEYHLKLFYNSGEIVNLQNGSNNLRNLKFPEFLRIEIPFPSLKEQHQIVNKIEELFSELDKGIENLKTAQQQLKVYRQAVLKWAFEGKLTNENVKDGELPEGWEWVKLREACDKIQDGSHFSPQVQYDEPGENRYMYITAKNIRNNYMDFRKLYYVDKDYHESIYGRCNPQYGDVLLTKDGINTGEVTLNTLKEPFSLLSSVCLFKPQKRSLKAEFLKYFIQSPFGNKAILESMTGTAIKRIILGKIKDAKISLPPLEEQEKIVQEIESRLSVCDKMEETISTSLQQAEALRQSVLKRAFEGKLVKVHEIRKEAKIVSISSRRDVLERKILACYIILMCYKDKFFGHTKFQKTLYLCEQHAQLDFDTAYLKKAAGPLDIPFFYDFLREAKENEWLTEESKGPIIYFEPLDGIGDLTKQYPKYFKPVSNKINFVIKLLQGKNTDESELIATIYAIWNNYIILNTFLDPENLIKEVYDWSESKAKFKKEVILSAWEWMKEVGLVPVGFGKLISKTA